MKRFYAYSRSPFAVRPIVVLALVLLSFAVAAPANASDRLHLPGKPVERSAKLVAAVAEAKPVRKSLRFTFVHWQPVKSTLRFLFK